MIDIMALLNEIKKAPYREITVSAPHTGRIEFAVKDTGIKVDGATGTWSERPGTLLARLIREGNAKPLHAPEKGEVVHFFDIEDGQFVQAGTPLLNIRHFLTKQEVIDIILKKALHLFKAPEKGRYYFVSEIDIKIKSQGLRSVNIRDGDEALILSRMKRETIIHYEGPDGIIYTTYFNSNESVEMGGPLFGVCPEDQVNNIKTVIDKIQSGWEEQE